MPIELEKRCKVCDARGCTLKHSKAELRLKSFCNAPYPDPEPYDGEPYPCPQCGLPFAKRGLIPITQEECECDA